RRRRHVDGERQGAGRERFRSMGDARGQSRHGFHAALRITQRQRAHDAQPADWIQRALRALDGLLHRRHKHIRKARRRDRSVSVARLERHSRYWQIVAVSETESNRKFEGSLAVVPSRLEAWMAKASFWPW